jgi:hypothetical protein
MEWNGRRERGEGGEETDRQTELAFVISLSSRRGREGGREERERARHGGGDREFSRSQGVEP